MKKESPSASGAVNPRIFISLALCSIGVLIALAAFAATPSSGTLSTTNRTVSYTGNGPYYVASTQGDTCAAPDQCDEFTLNVSLPADYSVTNPNDKIHFEGSFADPSGGGADYDFYIHDSTGKEVCSKSAAASNNPEVCDIPAAPGTFVVRAKPYLPAGTNYSGKITLVGGASPTPTPAPTATPAGPAVIPPRYYNYSPPPAIGENSGEPSIGYNVFTKRAMFIAGLQTLQITFPENLAPAGSKPEACDALWTDVSYIVTKTKSLDPILFTDQRTGRTFVSQLNSVVPPASPVLIGLNSLMAYTDDDGATYTPAQLNPPNGDYDHQTVGAGPYPALLPLGNVVNKGDAVYYCSQAGVTAFCSRSDDGGLNFNKGVPVYTAVSSPEGPGCGGIHGHVKVAPDGTVYLPNRGCSGKQSVVVSNDAGMTWTVRQVSGTGFTAGPPPGILDPSVAIASDGTLYFSYVNTDGHPHVAVSKDKGVTWVRDADIGAGQSIQNAVFMEAVAGDPLRAAVGFIGTTTGGNHEADTFKGTWYAFIATTYDGGVTWTTVNATPNAPVQKEACIWNEGGNSSCRNLLDFNEITSDEKGRVLYGYADGCINDCEAGGPNSYSAKATIARQSGGKGLIAAFDTPEPTAPQRACLSGRRDDQASYLRWVVPDNGGSAITSYKILRSTPAPGSEILVGQQVGEKSTFTDRTVDPAVPKYIYRIVAVNAIGEGGSSNSVELPISARLEATGACGLPGVTVISDPVGDESDGLPQHDITSISIAEPDSLPGKLIFTMKVANLSTLTPAFRWAIRFSVQGVTPPLDFSGGPSEDFFVSMITDDNATPTFTYGVTSVPQNAARVFTTKGSLDPASNANPDGSITLILPKSLVGSPGPGRGITGMLGSVRFSPPSLVPGTGGTNETIPDSTGAGSYALRAANLCLPNTAPLARLVGTPEAGLAPLTVQFDASKSSDSDSIDTVKTYTFNFGDGGDDVTQSSPFISHTFANPGEYYTRLVVTDSRGKVSSNTDQFVVEVDSPSASPTPTPAPTATATPSATASPTTTPIPSATPTPSATASPTTTPIPSATPTPTTTPTPSATASPTPAPTVTPSPTAGPSPTPRAVEFRNISTRVVVRSGDRIGIAGFILRGGTSKRVVVRGLGPSLKSNGVPVEGRLEDPLLELHDKDGALIATNDDWQTSDDRAAIEASGFAPEDPRESAIMADISTGAQTAVLRGGKGSTGIGLVEVYDLNKSSGSDLANISTRATVETADNLLIGGFIVQGDTAQRMVIRAIGPSLAASGINDSLADPNLELYDGNGTLVMANDNWKSSQETEIRDTGLQPSDNRESAIVRTLGSGAYTAVVRGSGGSTGIAVIEAYNVGG